MRRIRRQRTKGWRMPEGVLYVGRPSRWGSPFPLGTFLGVEGYDHRDGHTSAIVGKATPEQLIAAYRSWVRGELYWEPAFLEPLRGRDLACWCPLDQPCHADVLLELANQ